MCLAGRRLLASRGPWSAEQRCAQPCAGVKLVGGAHWILSRSLFSLCPGHHLFCPLGLLPRVHGTPWFLGLLGCYQPPCQGRDVGLAGWNIIPVPKWLKLLA